MVIEFCWEFLFFVICLVTDRAFCFYKEGVYLGVLLTLAGEETTKEQKVSIHNNSWVGKWGHLTQSKLLRVPNSLGVPFFDRGTWKVG